MGFMDSYVGQLRQVWGSKLLVGIGAEIILTNSRQQVLLGVRSDMNKWSSFGGHIDPKEDIQTCALRELYEEAGIKLDKSNLKPIGFLSEYERVLNIYPNGHEMQSLALVFEAQSEDIPQSVDGEQKSFQWFDLDKMPDNMQPFTRNAVELYKKWLQTKQFQVW